MQFWYTEQLRNYRLQFIRAFSNFYVQTGPDANGNTSLTQIPCIYGDMSRVAATALTGNSENKVPPVPFMSCYVASLAMNAQRRQDPNFVGKMHIDERAYDDETNTYLPTIGNRYTIERYMPIPYDLTMHLDILSNNTQIKEQIIEQLLTLYNPSIEIQTSVNMLDWTVISLIELIDINWSSKTIPVGTENPLDIATLTFKLPIWINPPAKVKKQIMIQEIVTNIIHGIKEDTEQWGWSELLTYNRRITTPGNYHIGMCLDGPNYTVSLELYEGTPIAPTVVPTINITKPEPTFNVGDSFSYNGTNVTISDNTVEGVVTSCKIAFSGTMLDVQQGQNNTIRFINNTGNSSKFLDVIGIPVENMGFKSNVRISGGTLSWQVLFDAIGTLRPYSLYGVNSSQLRLVRDINNPDTDITGWIDLHPMNQNHITWTIDQQSMPTITMPNINAIINPTSVGPGIGLPQAAIGQRYLITESPSLTSIGWGDIGHANPNDIIQFDGAEWAVSFDSCKNLDTIQYVINIYSGKLLVWECSRWSDFIRNHYRQSEWRLSL